MPEAMTRTMRPSLSTNIPVPRDGKYIAAIWKPMTIPLPTIRFHGFAYELASSS